MDASFWETRFAKRTERVKSSAIREILKLTQQPGVISLAGGLPAPELFPLEAAEQACSRLLREHGKEALQYSTSEGHPPLREWIAATLPKTNADEVLITSGSQQGLDLAAKLLVDPGDTVLVESPTYLGALQAFNPYEPRYVSVPVDESGMQVDRLEELLKQKPKFIYALPNFQNPSGSQLGLERRTTLVKLAAEYRVPILEDDAYHHLNFQEGIMPTLYELDKTLGSGNNVVYMSTFSKTLAPGLRVAWTVGPAEVIRKLVQLKQGADLHTATLNQMLAFELATTVFESQVARIRRTYRARRDVMQEALNQTMKGKARWNTPQGGMFFWLTLPAHLDASRLLEHAVRHKVAFVPGEPFHAGGGGKNTLRLSFSYPTPENIREGIARLSESLEEIVD